MCGIAGYSLAPESTVDRTADCAAAPGIAERGADAAGFAYRDKDGVTVHKQRTGASESSSIASRSPRPRHSSSCTSGTTRRVTLQVLANNHPIRHGSVVGIHNGTIVNDDELFAAHGIERANSARPAPARVDLCARRAVSWDWTWRLGRSMATARPRRRAAVAPRDGPAPRTAPPTTSFSTAAPRWSWWRSIRLKPPQSWGRGSALAVNHGRIVGLGLVPAGYVVRAKVPVGVCVPQEKLARRLHRLAALHAT